MTADRTRNWQAWPKDYGESGAKPYTIDAYFTVDEQACEVAERRAEDFWHDGNEHSWPLTFVVENSDGERFEVSIAADFEVVFTSSRATRIEPASVSTVREPVCKVCEDTHRMWLTSEARHVMCTHCPTPCQACRLNGTGAFCARTPCACECHKKES